jgi:hypothetical protein
VFDEITVSATRDAAGVFQPVSVAATSVRPEERPAPPSTLQEMIEGVPGVAETGQGGLFQTYSVRGTAGQRVLSMLAGARLVTDRRAGVAFSFVDPALLGTVDVVRGPSSSYYGSGALGGVIQAFPQRFDQLRLAGGYASAGGEHYQTAGWGSGAWSMGIARREAADARTPEGERLFSRFEQWSGVVEGLWEVGEATSLELVVIPSVGRDIGKPNREFPERTTIYPEEQHLVASFTARKPGSYRLNAWAHPNTLETRASDEAGVERVENEAADFGANAQWELDLGGRLSGRIGLDFFGRRGVRATEERFAAGGDLVELATTLDGEEDEAALYGALRRAVGRTTVEAGARFTYLRQGNAGFASQDDTAWSGFVGASRPLVGGFELAANLGTGLRFPSALRALLHRHHRPRRRRSRTWTSIPSAPSPPTPARATSASGCSPPPTPSATRSTTTSNASPDRARRAHLRQPHLRHDHRDRDERLRSRRATGLRLSRGTASVIDGEDDRGGPWPTSPGPGRRPGRLAPGPVGAPGPPPAPLREGRARLRRAGRERRGTSSRPPSPTSSGTASA